MKKPLQIMIHLSALRSQHSRVDQFDSGTGASIVKVREFGTIPVIFQSNVAKARAASTKFVNGGGRLWFYGRYAL